MRTVPGHFRPRDVGGSALVALDQQAPALAPRGTHNPWVPTDPSASSELLSVLTPDGLAERRDPQDVAIARDDLRRLPPLEEPIALDHQAGPPPVLNDA